MKKEKKKHGIGKWIVTTVISLVLVIAMIVANIMTIAYEGVINLALGTVTTKVEADANDTTDTEYFKSAYASTDEVKDAGMEIAETLTEEGAVLLKNENAVLPIAEDAKVSLFGHSSVNEIVCGTGSADIDASEAPTFKEALEEIGVKVNPTLWKFYEDNIEAYETNPKKGDNSIRNGADGVAKGEFTVNEIPWDKYTTEAKSEFDSYKDAAIVVISRLGGEMWDLPSDTYKASADATAGTGIGADMQQGNSTETVDGSGNALELTIQEREMLKGIKEAGFENVIVLINSTNALECDWVDDEELGVDSVMWIGFTGVNGLRGVSDLLVGNANPSGRLVDTYCIDNTTNPAMENFYGAFWANSTDYTDLTGDGPGLDGNKYYNVYQEGIYVGYRYYETRYEDFVLGQGNAGDYDYAADVKYPFGYGLSYTTFEYSNFKVVEDGDNFVVTLTVKNTGKKDGKDVVEVYFQSPYTDYDKENDIEKASIELCGFAKTDVIEAGKTEDVTITVPKKELRTYDANNAKTYILDAGDYYFTVGRDAHDALNNVLAKKAETLAVDTTKMVAVGNADRSAAGNADFVYVWNNAELDTTTFATSTENGEEYAITNQLETADINWLNENGYTDQTITYLSRSDWEGTWPNGTYIMDLSQQLHDEITGIKKYVPEETDAELPTMGAKGEMTLAQMIGKEYDDPDWEKLLNQVTYEEMVMLIGVGYHSTYAADSIAKPGTVDENGPQGFTMKLTDITGSSETMTAYSDENIMAATWNTEFMYTVGQSLGEDGLALGMSGLYGPAMNTHRTAYAGRNFEYYSEDGFLGGQIAAAEVGGIQSKGIYVYVKHFAFNDQETNTRCYSIFANEQAMREVYLEPFEHAIVERTMTIGDEEVAIGGAMNVMNSFGRVGVVWTGAHEGLMTNILRGEWGMDGFALTDYSNNGDTYDIFLGIMAGTDSWDNSNAGPMTRVDKLKRYDITQDPALALRMREATHRILYTVANSSAMNGMAPSSKIVTVIPWWRALIYGVGVVGVIGLAASIVMIVKTKKKQKEEV